MLRLNIYRYDYSEDRPGMHLQPTKDIIYLNRDKIYTIKLIDRINDNIIYELKLTTGIYIGSSDELDFMTGNKIFVAKE